LKRVKNDDTRFLLAKNDILIFTMKILRTKTQEKLTLAGKMAN